MQDSPNPIEYPIIEGIRVDIHALRALQHRCDPSRCVHARACCNSYEVLVDRGEMERAVGAIPNALRYLDTTLDEIDPFDETENGHCLNTDEDGLCVFAYRGADRGIRCSLHSAALDLGLPPSRVKPKACVLWPLFLHEIEPPFLTVQSDATTFACNSLRATARGLDPGVADILRAVFGEGFLASLLALL